MTSFKKKLTTVLLALIAAVCLTFGLLFTVGTPSSAAEALEFSVGGQYEDYLDIQGDTFNGLKNKSETETLSALLRGDATFRLVLPSDVTKIASKTSTTSLWGGQGAKLVSADLSYVTEIGNFSFSGCSALGSVTLGSELTSIGNNAFANCAALTSVSIPAKVTSIGSNAFSNCSALGVVTYGANSSPMTIGASAFSGCASLAEITVPANVTSIGAGAYSGCTSVSQIRYNATNLGVSVSSPFAGTNNGIKVVVAGTDTNKITTLPRYLFLNTGIKSVELSNIELTGETFLEVFSGCTFLQTVNFDSTCSVSNIGDNVFSGCVSLYEVKLPAITGKVESTAFSNCTRLLEVYNPSGKDLNVPGNVNVYDSTGTSRLKTVDANGTASANGNFVLFNNSTLVDYKGSEENLDLTKLGLTGIHNRVFAGNITLNTVKLPDGISSIPAAAFMGCTSLTSIDIPSSVLSIGDQAFSGCTKLASLTFNKAEGVDKLTSIDFNAFAGCESLKVVQLPSSVTNINTNAFMNCYALSTVYMPAARQGVCDNGYGSTYIFSGCRNLLIVVPSKSDYDTYKQYNFGNVTGSTLTYEVTLNLHSVVDEGTAPATVTTTKLFGLNYGYEKNKDGSWTDTNKMPVQADYAKSVWYTESGLSNKVDGTELNTMLADTSRTAPIDLYAKYMTVDLSHTQLSNDGGSLIYDDNNANKSISANLSTWYDNLPVNLLTNYTVKVAQYSTFRTHVIKAVSSTDSLTDAGAYVLTVNIKDTEAYGEWAEGAKLPEITVMPQPVTVGSNGEMIPWVTSEGGQLSPHSNADDTSDLVAQAIYMYDNTPYLERKEGEEPSKTYYVKYSYLAYSGNTYTVKLGENSVTAKVFANTVTYANNSGSSPLEYYARATVTVNNNYTLTVVDADGEGLRVENTGDVFTIHKTWYIATAKGNSLLSADGSKYVINGWKYNDKNVAVNPVAAPIPAFGSHKDGETTVIDATMNFELAMKFDAIVETTDNDGRVIGTETKSYTYTTSFPYAKFNSVINNSMPAAEYTLTVKVEKYNDVAEYQENITFVVEKGEMSSLFPNGADIELYHQTITTRYNNGADVSLLGGNRVAILDLPAANAHPGRIGAWNSANNYDGIVFGLSSGDGEAELDVEQFYKKFAIEFDTAGNGSFHPEGYYGNNSDGVRGLYEFGNYTVAYNIYAPSYKSTSETFNERRTYTLVIGNSIDRPNIAVAYTGTSLKDQILRLLSSDFYNVIFIDTSSAQSQYSELGISAIADYTNAGNTYVVLQIKPMYKNSCSWSSSFTTVSKTDSTLARFDFTIRQGINGVYQGLSIKNWNYGELTANNKDNYEPKWRPYFGSIYSYVLVKQGYEYDNTATRYFYGPDSLNTSNYPGFEEAPAGKYWLIPTVEGDGRNYGRWTPNKQDGAWIEVNIGKAEITWTNAPYIESWKYADDSSFSLIEGALPEYLADVNHATYFTTREYYENRANDSRYEEHCYASLDAMVKALGTDYLPAGNYVFVYEFEEGENNVGDNWEVYFNVIQSRNYWDITPVIQGWSYGDFDKLEVQYAPHFGKATQVVFQYRYIDENGVKYSAKNKIEDYLDGNGQLPVGTYEYQATLRATDDYSELRLSYEDTWMSFKVDKTKNSWVDIPNIVGWSEGRFNRDDNAPVANAKFGNIYYSILDSDGNEVVSNVAASDLSASTLNNLDVGNYTLVAKVAGTADYEELQAEAHFAVFEDSVGLTGLIAATLVFAVIAIGLAVCAAVLLVRRNKKIEQEFRKMVNAELRRK